MANAFLTSKEIARTALPILENNNVMAGLVHRDLDGTFSDKGDTIQVRRPAVLEASEFSGTVSYQNVDETGVDVKMDKILTVDLYLTSKEKTLNIQDFTEQIVQPAVAGLVQKIDAEITGLYTDIPYYYGTAGDTPDDLRDITYVRKVLEDNKVPKTMRSLVIDTDADAELGSLDVFNNNNYTGNTTGLTEASLGRKKGFNIFMDQNIATHTAGTFTAVATPLTNGVIAADATTLTLDGGAGTETLLIGDLITIGAESFTVTADATAAGGAVSVSVYPAVAEEIADGTAVVFPDKTATAHAANLAFHEKAFAMVSRPLAPAAGVDSYTTSISNGINMRVTMGYDQDAKREKISFDILCGFKTLYPELAARLLG